MKAIKIPIYLLALIIFPSCEKLVEIDPPEDQMISSVVFETDETANSAVSGLYATMMKNDLPMSYSIPAFTGLYGDELEYNQTVTSMVAIYKYLLNPKDALTNGIWQNGYTYIYQANAIIEGVNNSKRLSSPVRNRLLGEALFVRAFWIHYLSLLYGEIPIALSTDYEKNSKLRRASIETTNNQIIQDLSDAKGLLNDKYVTANSVSESTDRIRPNTYVVSALLARIYLQKKDFVKAAEEASRIISNSQYDLAPINSVFKRTSKEVLWQLELSTSPSQSLSNSYEARMFTLTSRPNTFLTQRCNVISPLLLTLFSDKDKRRTNWVGTYTDNSVNPQRKYYFPSKYKTTTAPADEYTTPLRLAEMYLIRAEASAELGKITEAINDVDKIRGRAGLDLLKEIIPGTQKQQLLDSINNERRRELFCEWGLRWFDIRRSSNPDGIMSSLATRKGLTWKSGIILWPIPLNDIINGGKYLEQNENYK